MKVLLYIYRFFCSLRLAVLILSSLVVLFAIGTFYESAHGRLAAQEVIYRSHLLTFFILLLALNIIAVMIDRWPWKKKHTPFLLAHFGIIFVIVGSLMTRFYGVDGNIRLAPEKSGSQINTSSVLLMVYSSFDAKNLTELYREKVFFFRDSPTSKKPHLVSLGSDVLKVNGFYPVATARETYQPALRGGAALRFQIEGSRANVVRWMFKPPWMNKVKLSLGPAQVFLLDSFSDVEKQKVDRPGLFLVPAGEQLKYQLRKPGSDKILKGVLKKGSVLKTGWMDFRFRLIDYLPKALPNAVFTPRQKAGDQTLSAIQLEFKGEKRWMGLNSHLFFFDEEKVYVAAYLNEKRELGFRLTLKDFKITRYPSSFKAVSYESEVQINEEENTKSVSMNHPLKFAGYTIYQSGFEEDEAGAPLASVFSVNKDPGRFIKYFGSLLIVLGSFLLFFRRNRRYGNISKLQTGPD